MTSKTTSDDLLKMYQASDLFISASTREGGPTSVTKAIACETPIFCTRVGGIDDILAQHQAGILVEKDDFKKWESELMAILEKRRDVKLLDHECAKEIFHWPFVAEKYIKIYEALANS